MNDGIVRAILVAGCIGDTHLEPMGAFAERIAREHGFHQPDGAVSSSSRRATGVLRAIRDASSS